MRKQFILILFAFNFFTSLIGLSQSVKSKEVNIKINKEERSAVSITSEAAVKPLQKSWINTLKKKYKAKCKSNSKSVISNAIIIPSISTNPVNIFAFFNEEKEGCEIIVAVEIDSVTFISHDKYPDEFKALKSLTENFVINFLKSKYTQLIKENQKIVNKSVKEEIKMQKQINKLEKSIIKDSENIQKLQNRIEQSKVETEKCKSILPELVKKTEEKRAILKELEKRKEKL